MNRLKINEALSTYLAKLEAMDTPDAIALHLQGRAVQGYCGSTARCALAEDITAVLRELGLLHEDMYVTVGYAIKVFDGSDLSDLSPVVKELAQAANAFIWKFDLARYPDLISPDDYRGQYLADRYQASLRR